MDEKLKFKNFLCEFNVIDNFWTARVTSHIPIKEVPDHIKKEKIIKPIKLINEAMKLNGVKNPRVAVQALNPHAEFGTEEKDEIIAKMVKEWERSVSGLLDNELDSVGQFAQTKYFVYAELYDFAVSNQEEISRRKVKLKMILWQYLIRELPTKRDRLRVLKMENLGTQNRYQNLNYLNQS
jgi:4-hydroxy-L-threonine phosphate dehydrogenase PdxA